MSRHSPPSVPPITDGMRANARSNPNSWLYVIDPAFDPRGQVPQWGVMGAYPVDARGEIEDRFQPNDAYRPSPRALGWPEPLTPLDQTIQLAKAGHQPARDVPTAVLDATLLVYEVPSAARRDRSLTGFPDPQSGRLVVPAYTSVAQVPAHWPGWRPMPGTQLVAKLAGCPLAINPDGPISAIIPAELLTTLAAERAATGDRGA